MWFVCSAWRLCYRAARIFLFQTATSTVRKMDMIAGQCWWCIIPIISSFFLALHGFKVFFKVLHLHVLKEFPKNVPPDFGWWISSLRVGFDVLHHSKVPSVLRSHQCDVVHGPAWKGCPRSANIRVAWFKDQASQGLNHFLPWWFVDFSKYQQCRKGC